MKAEKRADEDALLTTARFYMLLSPPQYDDAMKMVKSALKIDGKNLRALCERLDLLVSIRVEKQQ